MKRHILPLQRSPSSASSSSRRCHNTPNITPFTYSNCYYYPLRTHFSTRHCYYSSSGSRNTCIQMGSDALIGKLSSSLSSLHDTRNAIKTSSSASSISHYSTSSHQLQNIATTTTTSSSTSQQQTPYDNNNNTTQHHHEDVEVLDSFDDEEEEDFPPPALKPSSRQYLFFTVNFSPTLDMKRAHEVFGKNTKLIMNLKSGLVYERMDENGEPHVVPQYILVYPFGSVTFVNVSQDERDFYIEHVKEYQQYSDEQMRLRYRGNDRLVIPSTDLKGHWIDSQLKNKYTWNEEFMIYEHNVVVQSDELGHSEEGDPVYCRIGENDEVEVAMLDLHTVRIVSGVLAKSAALKAFEEMAEGALEEARIMNRSLKDTSRFARSKITGLVDQVAASEDFRLGIDLLIKVKEVPKKAWDKHRYYQIFTVMQNEHENEERYAEVKEILSTIIESNRFQIDLWTAFKGEHLEMIIIILIATELILHFPFQQLSEWYEDLSAFVWNRIVGAPQQDGIEPLVEVVTSGDASKVITLENERT